MSPATRPAVGAVYLAVWGAAALAGCTSESTADDPAQTATACELGALSADNTFVPWPNEGDAELVVGYQGYMLIIARVHAPTGTLPHEPKVRMTVARTLGEASVSTQWRAGVLADKLGHEVTEPLEMWLYPPDPQAFIGQQGSLEVVLQGVDRTCVASLQVRFVDDELCKHLETGEVVCADGSTKGH